MSRRSQVREQWNGGSAAAAASRDIAWRKSVDRRRRRANRLVSADCAVAVAPAKPELRADIAGKLPRRGYHASFNFDFLRLAVKLRQQAIDRRNRFRNVIDDDGVGAIVSHHIAAHRDEFLD